MPRRALHVFIVWAGLFAFWVILSGMLDAMHLGLGLVAAAAVAWLSADQLHTRTDRGTGYYLSFLPWGRLLAYLVWLAWEVAKANIQVLRLVLGPKRWLSPSIVRVKHRMGSEVSRVILGNSITLTPGTVTLDITDDGEYVVHAIDPASAQGLLDGSMARKVAWAFGEEKEQA